MLESSGAMDLDAVDPSRTDGDAPSRKQVLDTKVRRRKRTPRSSRPANRISYTPAQLNELSSTLVRKDAITFFAENHERVLVSWISMLKDTSFERDMSCSDPRVTSAFRTLDRVITGQTGTELLRRLAYVRLICLFERVEEMIALDRQNGIIHRESGYRNASIAVDIYLSAQVGYNDTMHQRREVLERKRVGRRWKKLAGPSPLLLLIYSQMAGGQYMGARAPI